MKTKAYYINIAFMLFALTLFSCKTSQETIKHVSEQMDKDEFKFYPERVHASLGTIQLSSEYQLQLSGDTLKSHLPFFGRSLRAIAPGEKSGVNFESTDFSYNKTSSEKGWAIEIKTQDTDEIFTLHLTVSKSGNAILDVYQPNKDSMSFQGKIE